MPNLITTTETRNHKIIRKNEVVELTGLSHPTIWRMEKTGEFPSRIQIGTRSVGWYQQEVLDWIESRPRFNESHQGR